MQTINKTDADAREYANGLEDQGDAELFMSLWESQNYIVLMGHFPHFGLEVVGAQDATVGVDLARVQDDNSHSELDIDPNTDPQYMAAQAAAGDDIDDTLPVLTSDISTENAI